MAALFGGSNLNEDTFPSLAEGSPECCINVITGDYVDCSEGSANSNGNGTLDKDFGAYNADKGTPFFGSMRGSMVVLSVALYLLVASLLYTFTIHNKYEKTDKKTRNKVKIPAHYLKRAAEDLSQAVDLIEKKNNITKPSDILEEEETLEQSPEDEVANTGALDTGKGASKANFTGDVEFAPLMMPQKTPDSDSTIRRRAKASQWDL